MGRVEHVLPPTDLAMISSYKVLLCALVGSLVWTSIGAAFAQWTMPHRSLVWPVAPVLGFSMQTVSSLLVSLLVGFSSAGVRALAGVSVCAAIAVLTSAKTRLAGGEKTGGVPPWAWAAAAIIALSPALAVLPKHADGGVILAGPIFDHAKAALIDEIARSGVPPTNPFFFEAGQPSHVAYYYLWHYSAAQLAAGLAATGWEADVALTWFSAFSSLLLMLGLATWLAPGAGTAVWVLLCSVAASLRPVLEFAIGAERLYAVILPPTGFAGWLFQAAWVPQHLTSASCIVVASLLISQLPVRPALLIVPVLVFVTLAGFESSTWIGGLLFGLAAPLCGLMVLTTLERPGRLRFIASCVAAGVATLGGAWPFLRDQLIATQLRGEALPIAFEPMGVFQDLFAEDVTQIADIPGYWLILL